MNACIEGSKSSETTNNRELIPDHESNREIGTAETIAIKNGFLNWNKVNEVQFTFNVDNGERHFERSWIWRPKTDDVTMLSTTDTLVYNRASIDSVNRKADASFINDKYWLLAPFNLVWDDNTSFSEKENVIAPISNDTLNQLTILYGDEGGYTPGDAYDFYFGRDYIIKEWVFRKANDSVPSMITTWEDYETFNEIKISKMRKDSTGNWKLYFTGIKVK